jgi:hypothetical protein
MPEKPGENTPPRRAFSDVFHRLRQGLTGGGKQAPDETINDTLNKGRIIGGQKKGSLQEIEVEFARNPDRGPVFDARHNALLITRQLIEALLSGDKERITEMRQQIARTGGFLMHYNGEGKERLEHSYDPTNPRQGGWLMAETTAVPVDPMGFPLGEERILGADGQFYVPPDTPDATYDKFPLLLGAGDRILDGDMISQEIRGKPQIAMLIGDIATVPNWSGYGFAAATEDAAFQRVVQQINAQRQNVIKYALAAIASVKAVCRGNVMLSKVQEPGLRNYRSLYLHTLRQNATGFIHGKQVLQMVPVELPAGDKGELLVDWYVTVQQMEEAEGRDDIVIRDENMNLPETA